MDAFRTAYVYVRNIYAGVLCETDEGYAFTYDGQYNMTGKSAGSISGSYSGE